jgi:pimeloyl-ACP methyl ester carboxylesterase
MICKLILFSLLPLSHHTNAAGTPVSLGHILPTSLSRTEVVAGISPVVSIQPLLNPPFIALDPISVGVDKRLSPSDPSNTQNINGLRRDNWKASLALEKEVSVLVGAMSHRTASYYEAAQLTLIRQQYSLYLSPPIRLEIDNVLARGASFDGSNEKNTSVALIAGAPGGIVTTDPATNQKTTLPPINRYKSAVPLANTRHNSSESLRAGPFEAQWRRIGTGSPSGTAILLPGGPGLSTDYIAPWAGALAKGRNLDAVLLEYPTIAGEGAMPSEKRLESYKDFLVTLFHRLSPSNKPILIGHSFSSRLLLDLIRTRELGAQALILLNCPGIFDKSPSFETEAKTLTLPSSIDSERVFAIYWKRILPLFFGIRAKEQWIRQLSQNTNWMNCKWLTEVVRGKVQPHTGVLPPTLFIHGQNDRRFHERNVGLLKNIFSQSVHTTLDACGHFPMLETPRQLLNAVSLFLADIKSETGK